MLFMSFMVNNPKSKIVFSHFVFLRIGALFGCEIVSERTLV